MVEEWHQRNDACYEDSAPHIAMTARICKYRDHLYYFFRHLCVELVFPSPHTALHLVAAQTTMYHPEVGRLGNNHLSHATEVTSTYYQNNYVLSYIVLKLSSDRRSRLTHHSSSVL